MNIVLVGMVTYGNWKYTKMALTSLAIASENLNIDILVVVGKPNDTETINGLTKLGVNYIKHDINKGFPASLNDIYQYSLNLGYAYTVIMGNDVLLHRDGLKELVDTAIIGNYDFLSGIEISISRLIELIPESAKKFDMNNNKNFIGENLNEWYQVVPPKKERLRDRKVFGIIGDTHNFTIFSKTCIETIGFVDVNFYPAYFSDNDYARRMQLVGNLKLGDTNQALYFHFWSRTIYEENMKKTNDKFFPLNRLFYKKKWGGEPGKETFIIPFNNSETYLNGVLLPNSPTIPTRKDEPTIVEYWRTR